MRNLKVMFGLAAMACMFVISAVPAMAAGPMFSDSKVPSTQVAKQTTNQVFTSKAGAVTCTTLSATGAVTSTESATQKDKVKYSGCTAFGLPATVSEAEYNFHATGTVDNLKAVTITIPAAKCSIVVPAQNGLKSVSYVNKPGGKIEVVSNVTKIKYTTTGGACGLGGEDGTYKGNALVEEKGSVLEWEASS